MIVRLLLLGKGPKGGWRSLDRWLDSVLLVLDVLCNRNGCGAVFDWPRLLFFEPKRPPNKLLVCAASPFSSLLTLDKKSRPLERASRPTWLLVLSLRTIPAVCCCCLMARPDCGSGCCCCCCCWSTDCSVPKLKDPREPPNEPKELSDRSAGDSRELPSF